MMTVYAAYKNSDMTEGKGPMVMDKIFLYEEDAQMYIDAQPGVFGRVAEHGWQNSDTNDWTVKPLYILEHLKDGEEYQKQKLRHSGLAKLLPSEKEALGLS